MIQELLGGNNFGTVKADHEKHKLSNCNPSCGGKNIPHGPPSSSAAAASATSENLRCPRCHSSNTKFCYYNNYNLTQPRHFCKTCRRYWTKGGVLRNVPIGGGCRKNRTTAIASTVGSLTGKLRTAEFVKMGLFNGFEHSDHQALSANPNLLLASPQNKYHFISLLGGANQNPNHLNNNQLLNSISSKEEGNNDFLFGSSPVSRVTGMDPIGPDHLTSSGLSLYRDQAPAGHGFLHDEIQANGLQELYQRLRSPSTSCYFPENAPLILGNMGFANSCSAVLESAAPGEIGFWNSNVSWPTDLSTRNGAYR